MRILEKYEVNSNGLVAIISIVEAKDFVPNYDIKVPTLGPGTEKMLEQLKVDLIKSTKLHSKDVLDPRISEAIRKEFSEKASKLVENYFPDFNKKQKQEVVGIVVNEMVGLGDIEIPLHDENLEEIVINGSREPLWVYHKRYGWVKTNLFIPSEEKILDYANLIGRRVGRQINILDPLMDAHLTTGDRVNATLFPISTQGNTITIRKFARKPWTIVDFIKLGTINEEVSALIWEAIQYELNVLVSGGTGSGKTSTLNSILPFVQPNQRIISIEDTRELSLPKYQHWVPLTTREPNPEGKGKVSMLDLMINSLRMRPDRIVVGEIRRQREAEVLFEAMHTGHSVYSTLHADRSEQVRRRLTTPPINISESLLESLHLVLIQYRHRRLGIRRTIEVAEVVPVGESSGKASVDMRVLYKWKPREDKLVKEKEPIRFNVELESLTGLTSREIKDDLLEKQSVLHWMTEKNINDVHTLGKIIANYYKNKEEILDFVKKGEDYKG